MMEFFKQAKEAIGPFLAGELKRKLPAFGFIEPWGNDVLARIDEFSQHGKMIRGGLVLLGHELYGGEWTQEALRSAAAMELFQSGFLIHDDIMDRDRIRRGKPSFFMQYARRAEEEGLADAYHQGESLGICGGDIALFLGFDLLSEGQLPPAYLGFCAREIIGVGLAQMQDVWFGASPRVPETDQILNLYTHKTGRYSFSLPLMAGAMLAGRQEAELQELSRLGELMGVIFQIRDDELGLFGSEEQLGKPIGSDIREGKKTIYYRALLDALPSGEILSVQSRFGSPKLGPDDVKAIRELLESSGARRRVATLVEGMQDEAAALIAGLDIADRHRAILVELLGFIAKRGV